MNISDWITDTEAPKEMRWNPLESLVDDDEDDWDPPQMIGLIDQLVESGKEVLEEYIPNFTPERRPQVYGMEVGDDRADVSDSPAMLAIGLVAQSLIFKMKTSRKDTVISRNLFNFCEVTSMIPRSKFGSISYSKVNGFQHLEYVDSPPLRIIVNVQKGDRGHSSSSVGKSQMLGSRIKSTRTECLPMMQTASWYQDSLLRTDRSPDPKYMPWILGGSGVPPLWNNHVNQFLYIKCYKNGSYERIYGSATNELYTCVSDLNIGQITQPVICSALRMRQDYLHGTYDDAVLVPSIPLNYVDGTQVQPLYRAVGGSAFLQGVENRLVQAGKILTKTHALAQLKATNHSTSTIFGELKTPVSREIDKVNTLRDRARFDGALQANSALQRLLARTANHLDLYTAAEKGAFLIARGGATEYTINNALWISTGMKVESFVAEDLSFSEDMYLKEDISVDRMLRVPGLPLLPQYTHREHTVAMTKARSGLWQVTQSLQEWADDVTTKLVAARGPSGVPYTAVQSLFFENREWISDDPLIVQRCISLSQTRTTGTFLLVSNDFRLGRVVARQTGLTVALLHPILYWSNTGKGVRDSRTVHTVREALNTDRPGLDLIAGVPPLIDDLIIDVGNLSAYLSNLQEEQDTGEERYFIRKALSVATNGYGHRTELSRVKRINTTKTVVTVFFPNGSRRRALVTPKNQSGTNRLSAGLKRFVRR